MFRTDLYKLVETNHALIKQNPKATKTLFSITTVKKLIP